MPTSSDGPVRLPEILIVSSERVERHDLSSLRMTASGGEAWTNAPWQCALYRKLLEYACRSLGAWRLRDAWDGWTLSRSRAGRLAGDTARAATSDEVKVLRKEARDLKEVVAEQALELWILKKSMIADGATTNEISRIREARDHPSGGELAPVGAAQAAEARYSALDLQSLV